MGWLQAKKKNNKIKMKKGDNKNSDLLPVLLDNKMQNRQQEQQQYEPQKK